MLDDKQLEQSVQELIVDICEVLYRRGYEIVPIGAVMRLVGVSDERARQHDNDWFPLDKDFEALLAKRDKKLSAKKPASKKSLSRSLGNVTIH